MKLAMAAAFVLASSATTTAGGSPNGWFFGIDISMNEVLSEWSGGYPFVLPLDSCGNASFGPIPGAPPGLTVYAVAFGFPPASTVSTIHSPAQVGNGAVSALCEF